MIAVHCHFLFMKPGTQGDHFFGGNFVLKIINEPRMLSEHNFLKGSR